MEAIKINRGIDNFINVLVTFMIMSFYLFELKSWGRYVLFVLTIIIGLLYAVKNGGRVTAKIESFHRHILAFVIFCFLSAVWAWNPSLAISKGVTILLIFVCFSVLYSYYSDLGTMEPLLKSIMFAGYGIAIYTILYYGPSTILGMIAGSFRIGNDYTNANSIGLVAATSCIIQFYYVIRKQFNCSVLLVIPAILMLAVSQSRKAAVMVIVGIVFLTITCSIDKRFKNIVLRIVLAAFVFLVMVYALSKFEMFSGVFSRFQTYFESRSGVREENIRDIYRAIGIEQFKKTPILGIGMGNSAELLVGEGQRRTYLHDNYVEILSSGGIIGFIVYYSMYLVTGFKLFRFRLYLPEITNLCLVLLVLILIMDYGMVTYSDKQQYIYFMCFFLQAKFCEREYFRKENAI